MLPVEAIRSSSGILVVTKLPNQQGLRKKTILETMKMKPKHVRDAIGRIKFNKQLMAKMKILWHTGINLIAAIDGAFGDEIGSSGYVLVFQGEETPILSGYAAEMTPFNTMESTREELMAMLAIEYVILILERVWGTPKQKIKLTIITDSESAKIARDDEEPQN